jgi:nucleoside-diphosphate-sugar epimerase
MSHRILITGGAGFIGSHLARRFADQHEVTVLDDLRSGYARNLEGVRCRFLHGSILDAGALRQAAEGTEEIYHLAAMISVPESVAKPAECAELNTEGTRRVLDAALTAGTRKVVLASSAAIYGDNPTVPKLESMPPEPKSPYAETKLAGERLLEQYRISHGLGTTSLRFFNVFGPRQDPRSAYAATNPSASMATAGRRGTSSTSRTSSAPSPTRGPRPTWPGPTTSATAEANRSSPWPRRSSVSPAPSRRSNTSRPEQATSGTRSLRPNAC